MLEVERDYYEQPKRPQQPAPPKRHSPLATTAAALMLTLGAVLGRMSAFCNGAAQRWTDPTTVWRWVRAVEHFRGQSPGARLPRARWEQQVLRFGSPILIGIGSTFIVFWLLLLIGGSLFWLVSHGFGLILLLLMVTIGTVIGIKLALLGRFGGNQERLN